VNKPVVYFLLIIATALIGCKNGSSIKKCVSCRHLSEIKYSKGVRLLWRSDKKTNWPDFNSLYIFGYNDKQLYLDHGPDDHCNYIYITDTTSTNGIYKHVGFKYRIKKSFDLYATKLSIDTENTKLIDFYNSEVIRQGITIIPPNDYYLADYKMTPTRINLDSLSTDSLLIVNAGHLVCNFYQVNTPLISIAGFLGDTAIKNHLKLYIQGDFDNSRTLHNKMKAKRVNILTELIDTISCEHLQNLKIQYCAFNNSLIECSNADTITIDSATFRSEKSKLTLSSPERPKTVLLLKNVDAEKLNLDYSKFHFVYFPVKKYGKDENAWKSDIIKMFTGLIASQQRLNNQQGIEDASIEMGVFQDTIMTIGPIKIGKIISWVKIHWNNYGFNKGRVVGASLELFIVFIFINLFIFKKLIPIYEVPQIRLAHKNSYDIRNPFYRVCFRTLLCAFYTGYIFFGLKFDFTTLKFASTKLSSVGLIILLLIQYVLGIVSLAYIANLIITK